MICNFLKKSFQLNKWIKLLKQNNFHLDSFQHRQKNIENCIRKPMEFNQRIIEWSIFSDNDSKSISKRQLNISCITFNFIQMIHQNRNCWLSLWLSLLRLSRLFLVEMILNTLAGTERDFLSGNIVAACGNVLLHDWIVGSVDGFLLMWILLARLLACLLHNLWCLGWFAWIAWAALALAGLLRGGWARNSHDNLLNWLRCGGRAWNIDQKFGERFLLRLAIDWSAGARPW